MKHIFLSIYQYLFARSRFYHLNVHLYKLAVRSLGVLNSDTAASTGEPWLLRRLRKLQGDGQLTIDVIVDIGANDLAYGQDEFPNATIYAFEPHPDSFLRLKQNASLNVVPIQSAVGDHDNVIDFWDFADDAPRKKDQPTSQLATLHRNVIEQLYDQPVKKFRVKMKSLDSYSTMKKIGHIDLLKIDAEGNELAVLKGASQLLAGDKIDIIQFEFNEIHAYSRVFMKDFVELLNNFTFYRLLPLGAVKLGPYRPLTHEIFAFQNIVAVRNDINIHL